MEGLLDCLYKINSKPLLYEPGWSVALPGFQELNPDRLKFWDDEHISASMLAAHLDPYHDGASRTYETIDKTINHFLESQVLKPGMKILDLGCGPGLYAKRLAIAGIHVTGLDISNRSLDHARKEALDECLPIEYRCMNFLDMTYLDEFDGVLQIYGELCTFSDEKRDALLQLIHRALKKDGVFLFDVSTRNLRLKSGLKDEWYMSQGGFWRQGRHCVLQKGFDYPEQAVWLNQYAVMDDNSLCVYRNWFHDYSLNTIEQVLLSASFKVNRVWNDFTGSPYKPGDDWIALEAARREI